MSVRVRSRVRVNRRSSPHPHPREAKEKRKHVCRSCHLYMMTKWTEEKEKKDNISYPNNEYNNYRCSSFMKNLIFYTLDEIFLNVSVTVVDEFSYNSNVK
jgi:hypothetical protein